MSSIGNYIGNTDLLKAVVKDLTAQRNAVKDKNLIQAFNEKIDQINKIIDQYGSSTERR